MSSVLWSTFLLLVALCIAHTNGATIFNDDSININPAVPSDSSLKFGLSRFDPAFSDFTQLPLTASELNIDTPTERTWAPSTDVIVMMGSGYQ